MIPSQKETSTTDSVSLLCVYAHEDNELCRRLKLHLTILNIRGVITNWYDLEISPGWKQEMKAKFNNADIILLLVSPDLIYSDYCYSTEMSRTLERHERGKTRIIPIILRPVDLFGTPIGKLRALPTSGIPVISLANIDEAFSDIAQNIYQVVLSRLTRVVPKTKEQWILEGKEHYDGHQYDEALVAYTEALDLDPGDELIRETVGRIQIQLGHYDEALTIYEGLLRTSPSASAYLFKGLILQRVGKSVEALAAYQKAREYGYSG